MFFESLKLRNFETKKPRNQETKKPRNHKTKKPRHPVPLNIPTPTLGPASLLGNTRDTREAMFFKQIIYHPKMERLESLGA